jgi:hypothetical protein
MVKLRHGLFSFLILFSPLIINTRMHFNITPGPYLRGPTENKYTQTSQLVKEGMQFTQHYAVSTVCAPS